MKDNYTIVQRIKSDYVGEDCIQVIVPYGDLCIIFNTKQIQFLNNKNYSLINLYTSDERKGQFPYNNTLNYYKTKKINYVKQIYEFNKPYLEFRFGELFESYAVKDGDEAILLTKHLDLQYEKSKIATREEMEKLLNGTGSDNLKKHYIIDMNGNIAINVGLFPERELVDKLVDGYSVNGQDYIVDLDGTSIKCVFINGAFKGHHNEFEVEIYGVPIENYTYEEIKAMSKNIKDNNELKIMTRFNKAMNQEITDVQKRLFLSKSNTKK